MQVNLQKKLYCHENIFYQYYKILSDLLMTTFPKIKGDK